MDRARRDARRGLVAGVVTMGLAAGTARAVLICGTDACFDLSGTPILPYGGEVLGATIAEGEITGATLDVRFTATGTFDAADIAASLNLLIDGQGAAFGFTGADLGWSGQGTFAAGLRSDALNGCLDAGGAPFATWFVAMGNLNPAAGPITGEFEQLVWTVTFAGCPAGDADLDGTVDGEDLAAVLLAWGECPPSPKPCDADVNDDGAVDGADLVQVILGWGDVLVGCNEILGAR